MTIFSISSVTLRSRVAAALLLVAPWLASEAQTQNAAARIQVPAVFDVRQVSAPSTRALKTAGLELVQEVTTAANVNYEMTVVATSELARLERDGMLVSVRTSTGEFVPLRPGEAVSVARGNRGAGSVTAVVMRVSGARQLRARATRIAEDLRAAIEFKPTAAAN